MTHDIIDQIDARMTIKVKPPGIIERFNGVDIQTKYYIKVNNATYINKIWYDNKHTAIPLHNLPLPMSEDPKYNKAIEVAIPMDTKELQKVEK